MGLLLLIRRAINRLRFTTLPTIRQEIGYIYGRARHVFNYLSIDVYMGYEVAHSMSCHKGYPYTRGMIRSLKAAGHQIIDKGDYIVINTMRPARRAIL